MNLDFLKEINKQLAGIWKNLKIYQRFTLIAVILILVGTLATLVSNAPSASYTEIFPPGRLTFDDASDVRKYLDNARIKYKLEGGSAILVPDKDVHRIRMDLAAAGLPKEQGSKGFELFDTNTWIKGEKELQILEMRALMGQLEKDISQYENIKSAYVKLDLAPPRPFGGSLYKAKASIIVNLLPGARLNNSQLRAITYHVSGAVRGLEPNMVAISDTTGHLYQAFDPDGDSGLLHSAETALEERLKGKIDGMLSLVVGIDNFYSTVQVSMAREKKPQRGEKASPESNREAAAGAAFGFGSPKQKQVTQAKNDSQPGKIDAISIGVLIDKTITVDENADLPASEMENGRRNAQTIRKEIESQLAKILEGYGLKAEPAVDFVEFDKIKHNNQLQKDAPGVGKTALSKVDTALLATLAAIVLFWFFNSLRNKNGASPQPKKEPGDAAGQSPPLQTSGSEYLLDALTNIMREGQAQHKLAGLTLREENEVCQILQKADIKSIAAYLKKQRPQTSACMLSHLDPQRAARIVCELEKHCQINILLHMAKLKEGASESMALNPKDGIKSVAEILYNIDAVKEKVIIEAIQDMDFELAADIVSVIRQLENESKPLIQSKSDNDFIA